METRNRRNVRYDETEGTEGTQAQQGQQERAGASTAQALAETDGGRAGGTRGADLDGDAARAQSEVVTHRPGAGDAEARRVAPELCGLFEDGSDPNARRCALLLGHAGAHLFKSGPWKELSAPGTLRAPTLALKPAQQPFSRVSPCVQVFTCEPCAAEGANAGGDSPHDAAFNVYYITREGQYARVSCCRAQLAEVVDAVSARSRERVLSFELGFNKGAGARHG